MALPPDLQARLIEVFSMELEEQSQMIVDGLLSLEQSKSAEETDNLIDVIFRSAHNIKGAARGVELNGIADVSHELENIFSRMRGCKGKISSQCVSFNLNIVDVMRQAMLNFAESGKDDVDLEAIASKAESLILFVDTDELKSNQPEDSKEVEEEKAPQQLKESLTPEDNKEVLQGESAHLVQVEQKSEDSSESKIVEPSSVTSSTSSDVIRVKVNKVNEIDALTESVQASKLEVETLFQSSSELHLLFGELIKNWDFYSAERKSFSQLPQDVELLLLNSYDIIRDLMPKVDKFHEEFRGSSKRLSSSSNGLQNEVRKLRLIPASHLLQPTFRAVRDLAATMGKEINFSIENDEIDVDRTVLEGLRSPLMHILRNSIDHGIESPEERLRAGKDSCGRISLCVDRQGGDIIIRVKDDGAGMDINKIKDVVRNKGLLGNVDIESLSDEDVLDVLFLPGFSTKSKVTDISGRGVGLDVVRNSLDDLKGRISIETTLGLGSVFSLRVPVTLTTERGLLVKAGGNTFAIPTRSVAQVKEVLPTDLIEVEASLAISYEGRSIPLRTLTSILELTEKNHDSRDNLSIVVLVKDRNYMAVRVDEIIGEREIIIKPLQAPLTRVRNISGGALIGGEEILMVLDTSEIITQGLAYGLTSGITVPTESEINRVIPRVLVVDDSITTRTLEKSIIESMGYDVSVRVDGQQAWDTLQSEKFDLIVTDCEMPVMNGLELVKLIKGSDQHRHIPVIMVTSLANDEDRNNGLNAGANAYIVKGQFDTEVLVNEISQLLVTHGIEQVSEI